MSNLRPPIVTGSILDRPVDPRKVLKWVTNRPLGPPIKRQQKPVPVDETPKDLGEERHSQLLSAIKGLNVDQKVTQNVTEALVQNRDWRH